jgi:protocatechuate 3,4-dioxygenase beta subunit
VTIKENGVAGVAIGLRKADVVMPGEPFSRTTTDQEGFYRIGNLAPGNYTITPSVPAFVMATKEPQAKNVLVGEDENVEGINFTLVRGGVITGRVTDAEGHPVIDQPVNMYNVETLERRLRDQPAFPERSVQTDDRGIYRFFGLSAGRYKVASGRTDDAFNFNASERTTYRQVFHPNTDEQAKATVIEVSEGSEASNIDIALGRSLQTFSASGVAVDEKGMPVANMRIGVQRRVGQRVEFVNAGAASNRLGEFAMEGLIPGKYGIYLPPNQNGGMRAEPLSFDITNHDIGGLTVRISNGASLTGFVVIENEDKTLFGKLTELQLRAFAMIDGGGFGSGASSQIGPDGSFRLAGLPGGTINLVLGGMFNPSQSKGFTIARVERDGIVSPSPRVEVKDGEQLTGLRVVVTYGNATIRGVVKLENGSLPEGARLFIRVARPDETPANFRPAMADARGHFLIDGLPAGTYVLWAVVTGTASTPPRNAKREVTVQDGQVTETTITIDMTAPVKP